MGQVRQMMGAELERRKISIGQERFRQADGVGGTREE